MIQTAAGCVDISDFFTLTLPRPYRDLMWCPQNLQ